MSITIKKCTQWIALSAICIISFLAFVVLVGDENPYNPMPLGEWLLLKALACIVAVLCVWVAKILHRRGYMPEYLDEDKEEDF